MAGSFRHSGSVPWCSQSPLPLRSRLSRADQRQPPQAGRFFPIRRSTNSAWSSRAARNAISGARGRILYNFSGSACEGYTSEFRQVSELDSGEGKLTLSDLRSSSWEDAAGKSYRFKIDTRMNDADSAPVDGIAERVGDHITVKLKQPVAKTFDLDGKHRVPDRADPAHHRRRARGQIGAGADRL